MTSFKLFRLLNFKKVYIINIFLYFLLLKYVMSDKLHHLMKKVQRFSIKLMYEYQI